MPIATNIRQPYVSREALAQGFEGLLHDYDIFNYTGATYAQALSVWPTVAALNNGYGTPLQLSLTTTTEHVITCTIRFNWSVNASINPLYIYPRSNGVLAAPLAISIMEGTATSSGSRQYLCQTSLWNAGAGATTIDFMVALGGTGTLYISQLSAHCHSLRVA